MWHLAARICHILVYHARVPADHFHDRGRGLRSWAWYARPGRWHLGRLRPMVSVAGARRSAGPIQGPTRRMPQPDRLWSIRHGMRDESSTMILIPGVVAPQALRHLPIRTQRRTLVNVALDR